VPNAPSHHPLPEGHLTFRVDSQRRAWPPWACWARAPGAEGAQGAVRGADKSGSAWSYWSHMRPRGEPRGEVNNGNKNVQGVWQCRIKALYPEHVQPWHGCDCTKRMKDAV